MKKALLFFILGFMMAFYWCTTYDLKETKLVKSTPQDRLTLVSDIFLEWSADLRAWFSPSQDERDEVLVEDEVPTPSDYEVALSIVSELIRDLEIMFTDEQKQGMESKLNEIYRNNILKDYGTSLEIPIYKE